MPASSSRLLLRCRHRQWYGHAGLASPRIASYLAEAGVHPLYYDTKYFRILFHHHCFAGINYSLSMFNEKY